VPSVNDKRAAAGRKANNCPLYWVKWLIKLFPAPQSKMLVMQVFMALLFHVGNIGIPAMFLHNPFGTENGILIAVMTIEILVILDKVGVFNVPPPITISNIGYVPGGVINCYGYQLAELNGFWHRRPPFKRNKATCLKDRPPLWFGFDC
jgi:hypothetical protein